MPMPHRTFVQVAKRRLVGKEGTERVRILRGLIEELPDYRSGPYADIRKWLHGEIDATRVRAKTIHRDSIAVRREGAAQVALVGAPNAGKSSLLQALSNIQIKTGDYAFTTTRPVAAVTAIGGVRVQLVEIPGLLEGAAFLAARVQLKLKHEFPEFTGNLLEQLVPNYLQRLSATAATAHRRRHVMTGPPLNARLAPVGTMNNRNNREVR